MDDINKTKLEKFSNGMKVERLIRLIALAEMLIGLSTIFGLTVTTIMGLSTKSPNVFIFVLLSAGLSSAIGLGILNRQEWARNILVFFAGYVILTKALIFVKLLSLNGEIVTALPNSLKNYISVIYHIFVIIFFTRNPVKAFFKN